MSNALNRLRQYFDDPLLVQVGRRMELTPRALALAGPVRDILVRIEAAVATPPDFDPATSTRQIALMVSDYSLHTVVPLFMRRVARKAPGIRVDIKPQKHHPAIQLERGEADLLIAPSVFCSPDHPAEPLLTDPMVCVLDESNPAARHLDAETFCALDHVAMVPSVPGEAFAARVLRAIDVEVRVAATSFSFISLPDIVRGTDRIAMVQERLARRMAAEGGLVIVPVPFDLPPLEQHLQWHSMRSQDPALDWLRGELHAAAAEA